ncbi:uncharacterized protein LOC109716638 [Ananas comosus]|uniref:Uncharacterized protein LOC109716638 n=1 Tax=Ananas comosus TaxID=4615 RepID=A0A6P5FW73_ANACO|nr:uncharacterized protein LOC109716638 [Ananas comosus]
MSVLENDTKQKSLTVGGGYEPDDAFSSDGDNDGDDDPSDRSGGGKDPTSQSIWILKTPLKIKIFVWWLLRNRLLTKDRLRTTTGPEEETCVLCASAPESCDHLFGNYVYVKYLLFNVAGPELLAEPQIKARELWIRLLSQGNVKKRSKGLSTLSAIWWAIWTERNNTIFRSTPPNPLCSLDRINVLLNN